MTQPPLPAFYDDLALSLDHGWQLLVRAARDRRAPMHTPVVATVDVHGAPQARVMVLRAADRAAGTLRFHTDARSAKVQALADGGAVQVVAYDPGAKVQLRLSGRGTVETATAAAESAWAQSQTRSLRCYMAPVAPGTAVDTPTSGLPPAWELAVPDRATATSNGRAHFAILQITLESLEFLYLAHAGHRRARFDRLPDRWQGQWLVP